jgi:signal transduction histidine kinase
MKVSASRLPLSAAGIRSLIVLGSACVVLAWAILLGGWLSAEARLSRINRRVAQDTKAVAVGDELELAILRERREDLLWEATNKKEYWQKGDEYLADAEQIASGLDSYVNTPREGTLVSQIQEEMTTLREQSRATMLMPSQVEPKLTELLSDVRLFKAHNQNRVEGSIQATDELHRRITYWMVGLSLGTVGMLSVGGWGIVRRVVRPTLAVIRTADDFGAGDLGARAPILHEDELGILARTFNNMADDIADREENRLQFVAMVVHDLKNPVHAIEMAAKALDWPRTTEEQRRFYVQGIKDEAVHLRGIIQDLTDDIQVANGRFSIRKAKVDLSTLVRQFVDEQTKTLTTHKIVTHVDEGCTIDGDAARIERVLMNLVSNAVKYSPPNTEVSLSVQREDSHAVLTVSDEGPGIEEEDLEVLFQPFGRGRSADTLAEGTGMGLYVVKQIVEAHSGGINVESVPGHGAKFIIRLPLV